MSTRSAQEQELASAISARCAQIEIVYDPAYDAQEPWIVRSRLWHDTPEGWIVTGPSLLDVLCAALDEAEMLARTRAMGA